MGLSVGRRWIHLIIAFVATAVASACANAIAAVHPNAPAVGTHGSPAAPVFVMEPLWRTSESGNIGRDFHSINAEVTTRLLAIVRERFPEAEIVEAEPRDARHVLPGYPVSVDTGVVTSEELNAAARAYEHGAAYLLVPTITEWKEMRTGDPIGAFILPHNSVAMTLRLMRLQSPALSGRAAFRTARASR